jgi:hypothetical protein
MGTWQEEERNRRTKNLNSALNQFKGTTGKRKSKHKNMGFENTGFW